MSMRGILQRMRHWIREQARETLHEPMWDLANR